MFLLAVLGSVALFLLNIPLLGASKTRVEQDILRVQSLLTAGDLDGAEQTLDLALRAYPKEGGLYNLRGIIDARRNEYAKSESDFKAAIRLSPKLTGAYLNLGRLYQLRIETDKTALTAAIDLYRTALRIDPSTSSVRLQLAKLQLWQGDFRNSLGNLDRLSPAESQRGASVAFRIGDLVGLHRVAEARGLQPNLKAAKDLVEQDVLDVAPVLVSHKCYELTRELLKTIDTRSPLTPQGLRVLGEADAALGKANEAENLLKRAASADPNSPEPLLGLARLAWNRKEYKAALGYVAHARDLDPDQASIHFFFGVICIQMDLPIEARKSLKRALQLDGENAYYYYALGGVELQSRLAGDAKTHFEKYVSLRRNDPRGHFALGASEYAMADYDTARLEMEKAAKSPETISGAEYFLGRIARIQGDLAAAVRHFSSAISREPDCVECHAERGRAEIEMKEFTVANRDLEAALRLNPDDLPANEYLLILYQKTKNAHIEEQRRRLAEANKKQTVKQREMLRRLDIRPYF